MTGNVLEKLGFSKNDRVVVFHADDIGMCEASLAAYRDLLAHSPLSSASTMVPCGWFAGTARFCREQAKNPRLDMGVHLTLTSEWDVMRWGPVSPAGNLHSLLDKEGYFPRTSAAVQERADVEAVKTELQEQIRRAKAAGIDITHIDNHMGSLSHPRFIQLYIDLGFEHQAPVFVVDVSYEALVELGYDEEPAGQIASYFDSVKEQGMPLFTDWHMMPLDDKLSASERLAHAQEAIKSFEPGLHYFIIHPAKDTPELRALAPDWQARVGDYNLFMSEEWGQFVEESGVKVIGMKELGIVNGEW